MSLNPKPRKLIFFCSIISLLLCQGCGSRSGATNPTDTASPDAAAVSATSDATPSQDTSESASPDSTIPGNEKDYYGNYQETGGEVALVICYSNLMDNGYNQAAFEGTKTYACAAGVSYSYYSASKDTDEEYEKVLLTAINNKAKLIVCASSHFDQAVGNLQDLYPDVHFLMLDGRPRDASGKELPISSNVHCIFYHEEEAGYLAGYMTVLEGYTTFGFVGGEQLPPVQRYGAGYLQGIDAAAKDLGISNKVTVNYWYADTFYPSKEIEEVSTKWYRTGTQIIFACGGSLYESILASADACNGLLIGVDVDQSSISERFLTSAAKGVKDSVIIALDDYFASGDVWPEELAGEVVSYGAEKKCIELPTLNGAWRFKNVTPDDYLQLLSRMKAGEIEISSDVTSLPEISIQVNYYNNKE